MRDRAASDMERAFAPTVAVDGMGSDTAPRPEVAGALAAAREYGVRVLLVGLENELRAELARHPACPLVEVVAASEVITMHEKAARAVRIKRNSSIHVAAKLVREGRAESLVSAGNTGAVMATAKFVLGSLQGVQRPALAAVFPTQQRPAVLLDVGANVDCRPEHLEQFAIMGEIYYRVVFGVERPRVGLLSIGEEEIKGNELTREAFARMRRLPFQFIGNVEGRDLYRGGVDVIVCDGFVGNVALKVSEGLVEMIRMMLRESLEATLSRKIGYVLSKSAYRDFKKRVDYSEFGGAPLLGVKGVCIICHGRSDANAIKNAVRIAAEFSLSKVNQRIEDELREYAKAG